MRRKMFVGLACSVLLVGTALVTTSAATASVKAAASPLGAPKKATGSLVTLGFVSDGKSDAIDNTPEIKAAQAAVSYANDYLGGLAGHKLALNVCETKQTPSGATDCATNMVQAKVPIVITPVSGQSGTIYDGIKAAGIPYLQYGSTRPGRDHRTARQCLRPHEWHRHRARGSRGDRRRRRGQEGGSPGDRRAGRVRTGQPGGTDLLQERRGHRRRHRRPGRPGRHDAADPGRHQCR